MNDQQRPAMQYCKSKHGLNYACWVAYRPIEEIKDLDEYIRVQTRATFVFEDQAKWFCKQFNDAIAQKVEPFQLGNECVGFDSPLASTDRAAMQMALEALEGSVTPFNAYRIEPAITALRERLAQPQGEWVDLTDDELFYVVFHSTGNNGGGTGDGMAVARSVIAKFKEKNTPPVVPQDVIKLEREIIKLKAVIVEQADKLRERDVSQGEPVAWMYVLDGCSHAVLDEDADAEMQHNGTPLYTTPPSVEAAIEATKEKAMEAAYVTCAEAHHVTLGRKVVDAIRSMK